MTIALLLGCTQIAFALACVREAKRKGRLDNWCVLAAAFFGILAYIAILLLPTASGRDK